MDSKTITTRTQKMWLGEDGLLYVVVLLDAEITGVDAQENLEVEIQLAGGQSRPMLVDARQVKSLSREARDIFAGEAYNKLVLAIAIIIGSPMTKAIGNLFLGINKPGYPTKLFTSEDDAIAWLKGFLE